MNNNFRYIVAGILIFLIILLQPTYLKWLGYGSSSEEVNLSVDSSLAIESNIVPKLNDDDKIIYSARNDSPEKNITLVTPLYTATISTRGGGSIDGYILTKMADNNYKYLGGYDDDGMYYNNIPVSMVLSNEYHCQPCLAVYDGFADEYQYFNADFELTTYIGNVDTVFLSQDETITLDFVLHNGSGNSMIRKSVSFNANNFISHHIFTINENNFDNANFELMWAGGLRPSEEAESEDIQYGSGIVNQAGEIEDFQIGNKDIKTPRNIYSGNTNWVAVRSKYFMSALMVESPGSFATLTAENIIFGERKQTPLYHASVGFPSNTYNISSRIYLGPLDVDYIAPTGANLDATMNWGWAIIRPISKGILWTLKFMHNTLHLNYGLALLLFALLIRLITGPLTKKSYESTQKMQKIQPQIKKIQAKYQNDPQRLNKETMGLYKKHGVNPLGGCLPMLLQMPLLMALFIVFRTTIEFRGQPFILWISDLSKPDVVFNLPFSIPIYGSGVAVLPLIMGITLFLTMQMSSATMDKNQKPVMYFMNGFFILLFNSFPSGLNLYYTAYNLMSFMQQRSIKNKLAN